MARLRGYVHGTGYFKFFFIRSFPLCLLALTSYNDHLNVADFAQSARNM
jgi:hypothetical protein